MDGKGLWYNKTICTKLNGQIFKDYLKTGHKERYELMCSVDTYLFLLTWPPCIYSMPYVRRWNSLPRAEARGALGTAPSGLRAT